MTGTPNQAYVIGIAGGSASGKVRSSPGDKGLRSSRATVFFACDPTDVRRRSHLEELEQYPYGPRIIPGKCEFGSTAFTTEID
jgi:hypothetical protein